MTDLGDHARREFLLIGVSPPVTDILVQLVEVFVDWEKISGSSVSPLNTMALLLAHQPLSPLTDDPAEWTRIGDEMVTGGNMGIWQSIRDPRCLSHDQGKTYWINDPADTTHQLYSTHHHN